WRSQTMSPGNSKYACARFAERISSPPMDSAADWNRLTTPAGSTLPMASALRIRLSVPNRWAARTYRAFCPFVSRPFERIKASTLVVRHVRADAEVDERALRVFGLRPRRHGAGDRHLDVAQEVRASGERG